MASNFRIVFEKAHLDEVLPQFKADSPVFFPQVSRSGEAVIIGDPVARFNGFRQPEFASFNCRPIMRIFPNVTGL